VFFPLVVLLLVLEPVVVLDTAELSLGPSAVLTDA
jgi:hypothetical protein